MSMLKCMSGSTVRDKIRNKDTQKKLEVILIEEKMENSLIGVNIDWFWFGFGSVFANFRKIELNKCVRWSRN